MPDASMNTCCTMMRTARQLRFLRLSGHTDFPLLRILVKGDGKSIKPSRKSLKCSVRRLETRALSSAPPTPTDKQVATTWVEEYLPVTVQPYARLSRMDKPIGTFLLLWPCWWSTALAANHALPDAKLLALFGVGAFIMRGAGCTINDMWDADFDKRVSRTRTRPLASGELSHKQALGFLAVQLTTGLGILLSLPHTMYCFQLGAASLPLVAAYPLMKRYTNWPQLVLGMTFNWGAFMGWAATYGSLDWTVVGPLYASGVAWTLVYDTLYAHQDKVDDAKLGLKSTALYFGDNTKTILHGFATCTGLGWIAACHDIANPFCYLGLGSAFAHLVWQIQTADLNDSENLAYRFRSNQLVGGLVFISIVAGNVM